MTPSPRSSLARTLRAIPTLLRVGVAETVAYRAEFFVWILTMTMPLVMLGLWRSVAEEAPFARYSSDDFVAYYLANLIVRNLTSSWVAWQMSEEIRAGTMSMRLLRPIHPFVAFGASHLAAVPFRSVMALPIAIILLASSGANALATDPVQIALVLPSIAMAWLTTFALSYALGCLAFWLTQSGAVVNLYFGAFSVLSGYLIPLDLMPRWIVRVADFTPFPSMLSTPVTLMTRELSASDIGTLLGTQLAWATGMVVLSLSLWRIGVRKFEAVGA